jgi:peptidoglycan/xylan/chitin deacetylase (PgdA/CDA1 family)
LFLLLFIIWQFNFFDKKLAEMSPLPGKSVPTDTSRIVAIKQYLKEFDPEFENLRTKEIATKEQHQHTINIPVKKSWIINVWRNNQPIITQWTEKEEKLSFSIPLDYGQNKIQMLALDHQQNLVFRDQYHIEYKNRKVELFRHSIEQGDIEQKRLALTFDGGSDSTYTQEILRILKSHNLKCTLFLTGKFMERHPDLVKGMVNHGHEIANHTYNHPHLTSFCEGYRHESLPGITREFLHTQLSKTDSIFFDITGQHLKPYWRAPFGEYNQRLLTWAAEIGYLHIHWTGAFDTHDWVTDEESDLYLTPDEFFTRIMQAEEKSPYGLNGVIVLMHLGSQRDSDHIFEVLPKLIQTIKEKGYILGCVSDLLAQ